MKKILLLLASLLMLTVSVLSPMSAFAQEESLEELMAQGMTAECDSFEDSADNSIKSSKVYEYKGKKYYGEGRELYIMLRDKIDRMETGFTVNYFSKTRLHPTSIFNIYSWRDEAIDVIQSMILNAGDQRLSVSCTDGDYLRWNMVSFGAKDYTIVNDESGKYCYTFKMVIDYRYDKYKEEILTGRINEIVSYIRQQGMSDYDAMVYIHDVICDSTTYDYDAISDPLGNPTSFSAYGALISGKAVCQGYALAFYRICKVLGFDVRFAASDPDIGNHAWNLIKLDGKYYFIDCTWDDNIKDSIPEKDPYSYFLVSYDDLRKDDQGSYAHTLYSELYNDLYFNNHYKNHFAQSSYNRGSGDLLSAAKFIVSGPNFKYTGSPICPQEYVFDKYGTPLTKNVDYTVSYSDNIESGLGIVTINGLGKYWGMSSSRSFNITPAKAKKLKAKSSTGNTVTVSWENNGESGCTVQVYKNGKWVNAGTSYTDSYTVKNLSPIKKYKVRVKPFETINRTDYSGNYSSSVTAYTSPNKVKLSSAAKSGGAITVKWKKTSGDGYQVQYSTSSTMKKAKTVKINKSKTVKRKISGLKRGKKYYVRVRAYKKMKTSSGKTKYYYGEWSNKKSVKL